MLVHKDGEWLPALDEASALPLYQQIVESVALAVATGSLSPGDRLPSVRRLAAELRINPNTAARSIREMEARGLSSPIRGVGSVVADDAPSEAKDLASGVLAREIDSTLQVAKNLGLGLSTLLDSLRDRWKEVEECSSSSIE